MPGNQAMRALISTSNQGGQGFLKKILTEQGYEVIVAQEGEEAWDILRNPAAPRLVILDSGLTGIDGIELCRRIRKRESGDHVYLVVIGGRDGTETVADALEAGANDYLFKSDTVATMKARLLAGRRFLDLVKEIDSAQEVIRSQATYDLLTGLESRVTILDILRREIARAKREEDPVGVVMIGMDQFNVVNETYGRRVGDAVLCEAARRVSRAIRLYDTAGRYADVEFLVVAPGCEGEDVERVAERIRKELGENTIRAHGKTIAVTASLGIIATPPGKEDDEVAFLDAAEGALNRARHAGGNCSVMGQLARANSKDAAAPAA